ncbi:MAG: BsSco [Verrucomicrobiota bacterium]|jgi:hypothetical protein
MKRASFLSRWPHNVRTVLRWCAAVLLAVGTDTPGWCGETYSVQDDLQMKALLQEATSAQASSSSRVKVFHGFRFTDQQPAIGITFAHHMTEDSGRSEKAIHYDHGSGVAVADVDGDGLEDLYFGNQIGGNQLWRNLGNGRFENITDRAGVAVADRVSVGVAFADLDNDGDPDLVVSTVREGNLLFENLGGGTIPGRQRGGRMEYPLAFLGHRGAGLQSRWQTRHPDHQHRPLHDGCPRGGWLLDRDDQRLQRTPLR